MLKREIIKIAFSILLLSTIVNANKDISNTEIDDDQNKISSADMDVNFEEDSISSWISEFEDNMNISIGKAENGRTFFSGTTNVRVNSLDPAYAKELSIAYDKAILNLQSEFIMQTYGELASESITKFLEDDSTNARQFDKEEVDNFIKKGKISSILDKVVAVIGNELDAKLEEQGVSPEEITKKTFTQKKTLFKDNFKKSIVKKAVQNISGLVPVQTKVVTVKTPNGDAVQFWVIAVISEKTTQFAKDISRRRATLVKGKAKNIRDVLPKNKKEYLNEFGLRYLYDEKGRPMLLSYGSWSVVGKTKNPSMYLRKVQSAKEKARMNAESYIGGFMKSSIQVSQSSIAESVSEEIAIKVTEFDSSSETSSNESVEDIGETIDKAFKNVKASSKFRLRGTSQLKTWETKDENGILRVGSVVVWTYSQLENANNIASKKFRTNKELKRKNSKAKKVSKKSKVINNVDDF